MWINITVGKILNKQVYSTLCYKVNALFSKDTLFATQVYSKVGAFDLNVTRRLQESLTGKHSTLCIRLRTLM